MVVVVVPLAGILVDVGVPGLVVPVGDGDAVVCDLTAFGVVVDGDVVDGDVVPGIVVLRVVVFCLVVVDGAGTVLGLPLSVPLFTPLLIVPFVVPLGFVPLFIVPFVVVGLVVAGLVVVGFVVPGTLAGFVCADAIPNANIAATVKINFFILLFFLWFTIIKLVSNVLLSILFHTN